MSVRPHRPDVPASEGTRALSGAPVAVQAVLPHRLRPTRSRVVTIERPFLLGRIEEGLAGQVVTLQAPAGFGKSELLASAFTQLRRSGDRFCWMTLDRADGSPGVFLHDLAASLSVADRPTAAVVTAATVPAPDDDVEKGIAALRERLLDGSGPAVIFLDDGQVPSGTAFGQVVELLLRRFPDHIRIVLASRGRPPFALSHLRTRNLLLELRPVDLMFGQGDLQRLFEGKLSGAQIRALLDVTEGWPALIALSRPLLAATAEPSERDALLAGTHPLFRDFIEEELLNEVPADLARALEVCTILETFPVDLAADLAGFDLGGPGASLIESLSPVLQPIPQRPRWLKLHPVLRATLTARSKMRPVEDHAAMHVRAAAWFAERGILDLAVRHAAHGGDFALAIDAIRRAGGVNIFLRVGYAVLRQLLADLPPAVVHRSPALQLSHALVASKEGQIHVGREIMESLKADRSNAETIPAADLEHIDGMIDIYEDKNLGEAQIARLRRAAHDFETYDNWERGWIYNHLCIAHQRRGDLRAARLAGLRALTCYREEKTPYAQIFMMGHLGTILMAGGRLTAAVKLLRETDVLIQRTHWSDENLVALAHIPLATSLYHQGHVSEAGRLLDAALPVVARGEGWVDMFAYGYRTQAKARFLASGLEAALSTLDEAEVLSVERGLPRLDLSAALLRAELLARSGLLDSASQILARLPPVDPAGDLDGLWPTLRERHEALALTALLHVRRGQPDAALITAERLVARAELADAGLAALGARVLAIEALCALDRPDEALQHLLAALAFAIPQQSTQTMRDGDAALAGCLRSLIRRFGLIAFRPESAAFLATILGPLRPNRMGELSSSAAVILTTREAEVLAGIHRGAANKEIARDLGLTEAAVKFHLKNLFGKLGVNRRTLALNVAKNVGLLQDVR